MYRHVDFKSGVEHQETFQRVLLVPKSLQLHHPVARIIEGRKDIMDMKQRVLLQSRIKRGQFKRHVAAKLEDVTGIHEKKAALFQQGSGVQVLKFALDALQRNAVRNILRLKARVRI